MAKSQYLGEKRTTQLGSPIPSRSNIILQGEIQITNDKPPYGSPLKLMTQTGIFHQQGEKRYSADCELQGLGCTVQKVVVGVSLNATLASPKSHILSLQLAFAKIFFGLRSR